MELSFSYLLSQVFVNPPLLITVILVMGVVFVNGWTDAPNAIATCVSTRVMSPRAAVLMAAVFNFLGTLVITMINKEVAETIYNMVDFSAVPYSVTSNPALVALCAALFGIVIWAVAAWWFGIPTSESHALIAGLSGAAIAMGGLGGINGSEWIKVLYGLILSVVLGFLAGFVTVRLVEFLCKGKDRKATNSFFGGAQVVGGAAMAFMHGAQDGQKFIGVLLLGMALAQGRTDTGSGVLVPVWMIILISAVMGIGTSIGGYRIIKAVGMDMVKLKRHQGFAADIAASACLLFMTVTGIPVSTTHTKTTAIMGVGASNRISSVNWGVVKEMALAWILTFPGCGLLAFIMAKIFVSIFQ